MAFPVLTLRQAQGERTEKVFSDRLRTEQGERTGKALFDTLPSSSSGQAWRMDEEEPLSADSNSGGCVKD
ncbi:MAG: hypothetical protein LBD67_02530 [Candidatus Accumulibacter sp.]|nr:hypothetical protein [Accumulibacter sp.]